jgi:hypothetical protein
MGFATKPLDTIPLTPFVDEGQIRFVLSWPDAPADLDIHSIFKISRTAKCEVFFSKKECAGVDLDVDNLKGGKNGVETITIREIGKYVYTFAVHRYIDISQGQNQGEVPIADSPTDNIKTNIPAIPLSNSKATVTVYGKGFKGPLMSVTVPDLPSEGEDTNPENYNWWTVFCLDGSKGINSITAINKLSVVKPTFSACENYYKSLGTVLLQTNIDSSNKMKRFN